MPHPQAWDKYLNNKLNSARKDDRFRQLSVYDSFQPGYLISEGETFLNLCANDYLGLASDGMTFEECKLIGEILPIGSGASRLVTGTLAIHNELEKLLAQWKGTESALVFPTGYQTNVGLLSSLMARGDAIFCDKLNHASLLDGAQLSDGRMQRYDHCDIDDLESLMNDRPGRKRIIVTDSVFSMDGNIAPLPQLNEIAKKHDALLVVDEAHATGVLGKNGAGAWSHFNLPWEEHVILMGTLSKAVGTQGGFVCASQKIIDFLVNYCRAFIYSTSLSPLVAGMAHYNASRIRQESHLCEAIQNSIQNLKDSLRSHDIEVHDDPTPIVPIIVKENWRAIRIAERLKEEKIIAAAIRPPTVPEGSARIRLSICSAHGPNEIQRATKLIAELLQEFKLEEHEQTEFKFS